MIVVQILRVKWLNDMHQERVILYVTLFGIDDPEVELALLDVGLNDLELYGSEFQVYWRDKIWSARTNYYAGADGAVFKIYCHDCDTSAGR